ncbi:MAG: Ig-like domain-containing protein, partial [Gammaproteobacteria bacterium]|nr:Ig-like domain-containing protein [Gammaproteobacteria bacterium]
MHIVSRLALILLVIFVASCGGGDKDGGSDSTGRQDGVITSPLNNADKVSISEQISAKFGSNIDTIETELSNFISVRAEGGDAVNGQPHKDGNTLFFTTTALDYATTYIVTIKAGLMLNGSPLENDIVWRFTTISRAEAERPKIASRHPMPDDTDIPVNHGVNVQFSRAMSLASFQKTRLEATNNAGVAIEANVTYSAKSNSILLKPRQAFTPATSYRVILENVLDSEGSKLTDAGVAKDIVSWTFTTRASSAPDNTAPVLDLVQSTPSDGDTSVSVFLPLTIQFSEAVYSAEATTDEIKLYQIASNPDRKIQVPITLTFLENRVVLDPVENLEQDSTYVIEMLGITDLAGNPSPPLSLSFKTAVEEIPPVITDRSPGKNEADFPVTNYIAVTFSESLDTDTVRVPGVIRLVYTQMVDAKPQSINVPFNIGFLSAGSIVTINPIGDLPDATNFNIYIGSGEDKITDLNGNAFAGDNWQFSTEDLTAPKIVGRDPDISEPDIGTNKIVEIKFDERIDASTVLANTGSASTDSLRVPGGTISELEVIDSASTSTVRFRLSGLSEQTTYSIFLSDQIADLRGNSLVATNWSFTTGDFTAPLVDNISPQNSASNVSLTPTLLATFNEPLSAGSVNSGSVKVYRGVWGVDPSPVEITPTSIGLQTSTNNVVEVAFSEAASLSELTTYSIRLLSGSASGVKDVSNNPLSKEFVARFTTGDFTPPQLMSSNPVNGAGSLNPANISTITISFDEELLLADVSKTNVILSGVSTNLYTVARGSNSNKNRIIITPEAGALKDNTTYSVTLLGIKGAVSGLAISGSANTKISFSTGDNTGPVYGTGSPTGTNVGTSPTVLLSFDENLLGSTVNSANVKVYESVGRAPVSVAEANIGLQLNNNNVIEIVLSNLKEQTAYLVEVGTGVTDPLGNALAGLVSHSFSTGDFTNPTIVSRTPSIGATGVAKTVAVSIEFDELLDASTVKTNTGSTLTDTVRASGGTITDLTVTDNAGVSSI